MSTITPRQQSDSPARLEWLPSHLYRMSVEKYEAMIASGALTRRDRVHLINGYLVDRMTQNPPHMIAGELVVELVRILPAAGFHARAAGPIRLPERDSEPEPDRCVVRGTIRDYEGRHPGPQDIVIVIEVADSSLADDRALANELYGPAGIPVYWIINLVHRQVEVDTGPSSAGYRSRQVFVDGQSVPVVVEGRTIGQIVVADILPARAVPVQDAGGNGA